MTNDIPAAPRLIEGWWWQDGHPYCATHRIHTLTFGPFFESKVATICGQIWQRLDAKMQVASEGMECRRCLRSLPKWEVK